MDGPGDYVPDVTEGITRLEDLPKPKIKRQLRSHKKAPCPDCGYRSYRDKVFTRTLHDLGVLVLAGTRPRRGAVEHFYELADDGRLRAAITVLGSSDAAPS